MVSFGDNTEEEEEVEEEEVEDEEVEVIQRTYKVFFACVQLQYGGLSFIAPCIASI
jgi:hypothetical protein